MHKHVYCEKTSKHILYILPYMSNHDKPTYHTTCTPLSTPLWTHHYTGAATATAVGLTHLQRHARRLAVENEYLSQQVHALQHATRLAAVGANHSGSTSVLDNTHKDVEGNTHEGVGTTTTHADAIKGAAEIKHMADAVQALTKHVHALTMQVNESHALNQQQQVHIGWVGKTHMGEGIGWCVCVSERVQPQSGCVSSQGIVPPTTGGTGCT